MFCPQFCKFPLFCSPLLRGFTVHSQFSIFVPLIHISAGIKRLLYHKRIKLRISIISGTLKKCLKKLLPFASLCEATYCVQDIERLKETPIILIGGFALPISLPWGVDVFHRAIVISMLTRKKVQHKFMHYIFSATNTYSSTVEPLRSSISYETFFIYENLTLL